jgi:RHS repeat-associated protein
MRTLYDGFTFEAIRESETFQFGGFTVRTSPGAVLPAVPSSTPGIVEEGRFRQVTEGYSTWLGNSPPQGRSGGEAAVPEYRYVGINATLYANGEAVAMNRYDTDTYTGGTVYLGKDVLGSVRGISNEYGLLEECYEYDALGTPYKGDLNSGINLGYTGKPYDTATGLYNYGYRDYQPEAARFTTVDPIRDGTNWFAYVNNDPVNWIDLWGLDSMYSTYIQGTGIMVSTYVPNNPNGSIDYENIRTYSFSAANNVSSKPTTTIPADKNETPEYYYPQTFPAGTWDVQISRTVSPDEKNAPQLGTVYVNTTAQQTVPTYGATAPLPGAAPTNTQIDSAYGIHYKENGITAGCIAIGSQKEAEQFAALSDQALRSENGKSTITVTKGK